MLGSPGLVKTQTTTAKVKPGSQGKPRRPANVVGPKLRHHRLQAGLTQKELAALCAPRGVAITRGTLAKIEAQVRWVKACELYVLAKALEVPIENFYPPGFGLL